MSYAIGTDGTRQSLMSGDDPTPIMIPLHTYFEKEIGRLMNKDKEVKILVDGMVLLSATHPVMRVDLRFRQLVTAR